MRSSAGPGGAGGPDAPFRDRGVRPPAALAVALACALATLACAGEDGDSAGAARPAADARAPGALPDTVRIAEPGLHPECLEWDAERDRFLVSSVTTGRITAVRDDGAHAAFIEDPDVAAAIGIELDADRGRLLVASSDLAVFEDSTARGRAMLGIYDLATGERLRMVDLGALRPDGRHFANDIAVGPDGSAYVTDSFSPVLYRVDPDGSASVFAEDDRLSGEPIGLNGIDFHPGGYLIAAVAGRRGLVRVPLDDPSALSVVALDEPFAADGLTLRPDGSLVAVATTFPEEGEPRPEVLLARSARGRPGAAHAGYSAGGGGLRGESPLRAHGRRGAGPRVRDLPGGAALTAPTPRR